jgi:hypothetical protein
MEKNIVNQLITNEKQNEHKKHMNVSDQQVLLSIWLDLMSDKKDYILSYGKDLSHHKWLQPK